MASLDELISTVLRMAEKGQQQEENKLKAQGIDNFGSVGFKNNQERAYLDSRNDIRDKGIVDKEKTRDLISAQRDINNLAHPESQLSSQDRYLQYLEDIKQKRLSETGANRLQNSQSLQHEGAAQHYTGSGALNQAQADTQNALRPALERLPAQAQILTLLGKDPNMAYPEQQVVTPGMTSSVPSRTDEIIKNSSTPSYTDETVKMSPVEQALIYGNSNTIASPLNINSNIRKDLAAANFEYVSPITGMNNTRKKVIGRVNNWLTAEPGRPQF